MLSPDLPVADVLASLTAFAEEAAQVALEKRRGGLTVSHKGDGLGQALTEADQAISALMADRFGPRLIEEETATRLSFETCRALLAEEAWTVIGDPIDGTRPFSGGLSAWGTMVAACRNGWPVASVLSLPAWVDRRDRLDVPSQDLEPHGVIIQATAESIDWAPTRNGRPVAPFARLQRPNRETGHVGWLPVAVQNFTLDYSKGFFPFCESASVSDFASLLSGRLDATTFNSALWDLAAALPAFAAQGFRLYSWPDLRPAPSAIVDLFEPDFYSGSRLWLVARSEGQARALAGAIRRTS